MSALNDFNAAYSTLVQALDESADHPGLGGKAARAYAALLEQNEALRAHEAAAPAIEAFNAYEQVVRTGFLSTEARSLARQAFTSYLRSVKAAWAALDESTVDATALTTIAQSMLGAAWLLTQSGEPAGDQLQAGEPTEEVPAPGREWGRTSVLLPPPSSGWWPTSARSSPRWSPPRIAPSSKSTC